MSNVINIKTGNPIVDQVATLNLTGNVIPESWYQTIKNNKGKTNPLAILILADIVYWYRPTETRDETTLNVTYSKKFKDKDYLQKSYEQLKNKFNITKKQARDALILLEELGVVKRHFKNIVVAGLPLSNVMFIELFPDVLAELTYPSGLFFDHGGNKNVTTPSHKSDNPIPKTKRPYNEYSDTYTKTKTEINTKTSTTTSLEDDYSTNDENLACVVAEAKEVFKGLGLSDRDITSIVKASANDIDRCKNAKSVLDQQSKTISNVAGWLIKAVKENYQPLSKSPAKKNSFHNFQQREYTDEQWNEIERKLLGL